MIAVQVQPDEVKVKAATKPTRSHGKGLANWIGQECIRLCLCQKTSPKAKCGLGGDPVIRIERRGRRRFEYRRKGLLNASAPLIRAPAQITSRGNRLTPVRSASRERLGDTGSVKVSNIPWFRLVTRWIVPKFRAPQHGCQEMSAVCDLLSQWLVTKCAR